MSQALTIPDLVYSLEKDFNQVNTYKMNFAKEAQFALQLLQSNAYLLKAAKENEAALEYAIINLASIGITLNPALKEAYLVPRGGKICLDISYIGLVKLATDTGAIDWVQAEIVKKNDKFKSIGVGHAPIHEVDHFSDRGEVVGVYCVAKLSTGECLSTIMSKAECDAIRDKSSQASKSGPWVSFYEEMLKKTCIKRASKLWPKSERVQKAADILNEHEGIDFEKTAFANAPSEEAQSENVTEKISALLVKNNKSEEALLKYINGKFKTEMTSIVDFLPAHNEEALRAMGGAK
jgi:recombination protein RecT